MQVNVQYFAVFREQRGLAAETIDTSAQTAGELFEELWQAHRFTLDPLLVRVAVDGAFTSMDTPLREGTTVVYIPPVAGG